MDIIKLLDSLSSSKRSSSARETWVVAGLGNPGKEYDSTRHNAGFLAADVLAEANNCKYKNVRKALETEFTVKDRRVILIKPQTYMNKSGEAVRAALDFYKVPPERLIVVYDDINLDPGVLRIRKSGSAGGHNGMKSIIEHLGTDAFPRVRIGVGAKPDPRADLADHVLGRPKEEDRKKIAACAARIKDALPLILDGKADEAQSLYCKEKV